MSTKRSALMVAITNVGTASELARQLGISPSAVLQWDEVPVRRVLDVERVTGVSRHQLRPDIYGPAPQMHEVAA